jgi:hypothetical protein
VPKPAEDGALLIVEDTWLTLENGVQIYFDSSFRRDTNSDHDHFYGTGDYWTIAARTETGDVEWLPETDDQGEVILDSNGNPRPGSLPPHGVTHHYAPLAIVLGAEIIDVRNVFCPVQPCPPSNTARVKKRG